MNLSIYLSTGDHYATGLVIPAVPSMIDIMSSEHYDPDSIALKEQICWAIGNIAGIWAYHGEVDDHDDDHDSDDENDHDSDDDDGDDDHDDDHDNDDDDDSDDDDCDDDDGDTDEEDSDDEYNDGEDCIYDDRIDDGDDNDDDYIIIIKASLNTIYTMLYIRWLRWVSTNLACQWLRTSDLSIPSKNTTTTTTIWY